MSHNHRRATGAMLLTALLFSAALPAQTLLISGPDGQVQVEDQALGQYGPTKRNDTLWRIATEVRPDTDLTVYQVMQALFDANPHAFTADNFNSLERNHTLTVPTRDVIQSYPASDAKARAKNHDSDWQGTPAASKPQPATKPQAQNQAVAQPQVTEQLSQLQQENKRLQSDLDNQKEAVFQLQNLRAELDANADEMALMVQQNAMLQRQMEQLSKELAMLQSALDEQQNLNRTLEQELDNQRFNQPQVASTSPVVNEPEPEQMPSFWQELGSNTLVLVLLGSIPVLVAMAIFMIWNNRRHRPISANPIKDGEMIAPISTPADPLTEMVPEMPANVQAAQAATPPPPPAASAPVAPAASEEAGIQLDGDLGEGDILSLDELLQDTELTAPDADHVFSDSSSFDEILATANAEVESVLTPSETPETTSGGSPDTFGSDDFIDIDKLLAESENAPSPDPSVEADTIAPLTDPVSDDGGYNAKLDLARAYIEIEDVDSAKALLKEVEAEGNDAQRKEAALLLEQL
ncbi:FimV/HubP family polar landmark protein [uncultured Ferrimonas sp.]|uniref:FimV/HubP family polar landmark protein n=1 Tax=uncultured Ferrimonas sp. TaxID=432640 RepID=UPI00260DC5DC|nr:FimV/HubP family polar landmark protein [uncultured Ferrimonas sp.]